jgi:uncharacterized protein YceK
MTFTNVKVTVVAMTIVLGGCASVTVRQLPAEAHPRAKPAGCPIAIVRWPLPEHSIVPLAVLDLRDPNGVLAT